ncbi:MAG: hypothetical protein L0I76_21975 [Pseudonocardia sp.]|nr:hypothetical protein [Pseudonocardia sp.]
MFRWGGRADDDAPDDATLAARDAATQSFLALDDEQRAAAVAVGAADELSSQPPLAPLWEQTAAVGGRATEAYLAATRQFPLDGSGAHTGARAADEQALREIEAARAAIRRFRSTYARRLDEADAVLRAMPTLLGEARTALVEARGAIAQTEAAGLRSRRAHEHLVEAEQAAVGIDDDSLALGERRDRARRVRDLARRASTLAADAPRTASTVRSTLSSVATRRSAAAEKTDRIGPDLSALRREFSDPCSRDLADARSRADGAITDADRAIADARRLADDGDWDDAVEALAVARSALSVAEDRCDAVRERLADLRDVRADPVRRAAEARFVLRDAQRLVVDRGLVGEFGQVLDAQATRLDNARARLTGVHPDYWFYLTELRGVRDRVEQVVQDVRATQR